MDELKSADAKDVLNVKLDDRNAEIVTSVFFQLPNGELFDIDYVPSQMFTYFPNVKLLSMMSKIKTIAANSFEHATKLESLTLGPDIEAIQVGAFNGAINLKELTFSNKITNIDDNTFSGLDELQSLILLNNKLTVISSNMFTGLPKLSVLSLEENTIETIEDGALNLPSVTSLILSGNKLNTLPDMVFAGLPNLNKIELNHAIKHIGKSLDILLNIEVISMNDNQIDDIDLFELAKLPKLTELSLENSGFSFQKLNEDKASIESTLKVLNIGRNNLTDPTELLNLKFLTNLESLNLNENLYTNFDLGQKSIKEILPKLTFIHLKSTKISEDEINKLTEEMKVNGITVEGEYESRFFTGWPIS